MTLLSRLLTLLCLCLIAAAPIAARADTLASDLSENQIAITSNFTGKTLVLFGAIDRSFNMSQLDSDSDQRDIIVEIRGPNENTVVRKKQRVAGIWTNNRGIEFENVPGYYFLSSNRDLKDIAADQLFSEKKIGSDHLDINPVNAEDPEGDYRAAVIRNLKAAELFFEEPGGVQFIDRTLFRTTVVLPANIPVGVYTTKVYLIHDGRILRTETKPLYINKTGIERSIYEFAYDSPFAYGVFAVLAAFLAGWLASLMFRED